MPSNKDPQTYADKRGNHYQVFHTALDGPAVYLDGLDVAPLLRAIRTGMTLREMLRAWQPHLELKSGLALAARLVAYGILVSSNRHGE